MKDNWPVIGALALFGLWAMRKGAMGDVQAAADGQGGYHVGDTVTGGDGHDYVCTRAESPADAGNTNAALWRRADGSPGVYVMSLGLAGLAPYFSRGLE